MSHQLTPYLALLDLTPMDISEEDLETVFAEYNEEEGMVVNPEDNILRYSLNLEIDKEVLEKHLKCSAIIRSHEDIDINEFEQNDGTYTDMLAFLFDEFSEAFNDNAAAQKNILSHSILLTKTFGTTIENVERVFGTYLNTSAVPDGDDGEVLACSYTIVFKANSKLYMMVHYVNSKIIPVDNNLMKLKLDAEYDEYTHFSVNQATNVLFAMLGRNGIKHNAHVKMERSESFYLMEAEENIRVFNYNKLFSKFIGDMMEEPTKFYRLIKPCGLFAVDALQPIVPTDVEYVNSMGVASLMEDIQEDTDWLTEDLIDGVEEFGTEDYPREGVLFSFNVLENKDMLKEFEVAIEASMYSTAGIIGYEPLYSDVPEKQLFKDISDIYHGVLEKTGSLLGKRNIFIDLDGEDHFIETSFGKIDVTQQPVWFLLLGIPFLNYLMRTHNDQSDFDETSQEILFDHPLFEQAVTHLRDLVYVRLN